MREDNREVYQRDRGWRTSEKRGLLFLQGIALQDKNCFTFLNTVSLIRPQRRLGNIKRKHRGENPSDWGCIQEDLSFIKVLYVKIVKSNAHLKLIVSAATWVSSALGRSASLLSLAREARHDTDISDWKQVLFFVSHLLSKFNKLICMHFSHVFW